MVANHTEQLVCTESDDGFLLEGALLTPADGGMTRLPVVWMHGFTGRFYEQHTLAIGRRLASRGHVFVTGNNRGHHLGASLVNVRGGEPRLAGGWWENFEEYPLDYAAWIAFTVGLGFEKVVLAGHSLGAAKAVAYMGTRQDPRVAALISASGPLRMAQRLRQDPDRFKLAERMLADGHGQELLPADASGRIVSAQTLVSRARAGVDVYGLERDGAPLASVQCPVLFVLGSEETEIATQEDLPLLRSLARAAAHVETLYVEGANHVYQTRELVVADGIGEWLDKVETAEPAELAAT